MISRLRCAGLRSEWGVRRLLEEAEKSTPHCSRPVVNEISVLVPVIFGGRDHDHGGCGLQSPWPMPPPEAEVGKKRIGDELFLIYKVLRRQLPDAGLFFTTALRVNFLQPGLSNAKRGSHACLLRGRLEGCVIDAVHHAGGFQTDF